MVVKRQAGTIGAFERLAPVAGWGVAAVAVLFGAQVAGAAAGGMDVARAMPFLIFAGIVALGASLDAGMIRRGGLSGRRRLARHVWRICTAFFIATASFFLGQQTVMPLAMQGSPLLFVPAFAPLAMMIFWMFKLRRGGTGRGGVVTA